MFSRSRAGAAATLRPRPFFGAAVAAATAAATGGSASSSSAAGEGADGVAAAAAAVLAYNERNSGGGVDEDAADDENTTTVNAAFSSLRGATLGAVSDAAVEPSALRAPTTARKRGGENGENEEREEEEEEEVDESEASLEWMARHAVDFLDAAALIQAALSHQYCTPETCPAMRAGPRHEYLWAEPEVPGGRGGKGKAGEEEEGGASTSTSTSSNSSSKKPCRLPAPHYASALFSWADALLASPQAFPQSRGEPFPPDFKRKILQPLYRRLARVFAHFYHAHWRQISDDGGDGAAPLGEDLSPHLNTVFKHYVAFGREHGLLPEQELDPVRPLVEALLPNKAKGAKGAKETKATKASSSLSSSTKKGKKGNGESKPSSKNAAAAAGGKTAVEVSAVVA